MGDGTTADGLGNKAVDSHELHKKRVNISKPQSSLRSRQISYSGASSLATPHTYSELCPEIRDTPMEELHYSPSGSSPNLPAQSNVYPQRSNPRSGNPTNTSARVPTSTSATDNAQGKAPKPGTTYSDITNHSSFKPLDTFPYGLKISDFSENPSFSTPTNSVKALPGDVLNPSLNQSEMHKDRICSLVQTIEDEMHKSGINVNFSQLKSHLLRIREENSNPGIADLSSELVVTGEFVEVECNSPHHTQFPTVPSSSGAKEQFKETQNQAPDPGKPKNWSSLFTAQAPSKVMKLEHFPEMQTGSEAIAELNDSEVDSNTWNHCLIGYFLDGKMPYRLLCATARAVWKENSPVSIKQIGSCFFFFR